MRKPDYVIIGMTGAILAFGLVMLTSASGPTAFQKFGDTYYFLKKQLLVGVLPGLVLCAIAARLPVAFYKRVSPWCLPAAVAFLALPLLPGLGARYGNAWLNVGGFSFQTSEVAKLLLACYFAWWFARRGEERVRTFWNGLLPFIVSVGIVVAMMMAQGDLGTTAVIMAMLFTMYIAAGASWAHLGALAAGAAAMFLVFIKIAPYRAARLQVFLHPELDPQGVGYHVNQALLAVGTGGLFGLGLGKSRQKFLYLPEVTADSIFAIIAEEMGFFISAALIFAFLFLFWRGLDIARRTSDDFTRYFAVGIVAWLCFQAFLNIAAMVGLMPLTGVPLPFVSAGGSAMMSNLAAVGVLLALSKGEGHPHKPHLR